MHRFGRFGVGTLVGVSAAITLLVGCADILDLPEVTPAASSSSSSSGTGGTGGEMTGGGGMSSSSSSSGGSTADCVSNTDCATPLPLCDVPKGQCVECLVANDCSLKPLTVCSAGSCACPTPGESYCRENDRCVDLQTNTQDCGSCDHPCFGSCVAGKCADAWEPTPWKNAPAARASHVAVWNGSKMIVWGGDTGGNTVTNTGGMLDLAGYKWEPTSMANAPTARRDAKAVWASNKMVMWGGRDGSGALKTGALFDPATNTWTAMATEPAFAGRYGHSMISTGTKVIIWGGTDGSNYFGDGAAYDIATNTWETVPTSNGTPPSARAYHSAIWTGTEMIIFGGYGFNGTDFSYLGDGFEFNPGVGSWVNVKDGQPPARWYHGAAWTTTEMIIWGGEDIGGLSQAGSSYKPKLAWTAVTQEKAPEPRVNHSQIWIAPRLIVWGGQKNLPSTAQPPNPLDTGALYDPATNSWSATPIPLGPTARTLHSTVNANGKMVVFGGITPSGLTNTGAILDPSLL